LADLAVRAEHQHHVAAAHGSSLTQPLIGGDEGHAHPAGFGESDAGGLLRQVRRREHEVAGMGPVAPNAEVAAGAPNLPPEELLRPFDNHAGIVATRRARPDRVRHATEYRPHVTRVHSCTADRDHGITGGQVVRQIDLGQLQRGVKRLGAVNFCRDADSGAAPGGEGGGGGVHAGMLL
jgi:hypothetical protein